ncbi:MAG: hypothetical protein ACOCU4_08900 [Alkalispirochaeta sp.]
MRNLRSRNAGPLSCFPRTTLVALVALSGLLLAPVELPAQTVFGLQISRLFVTAMPVWMYNGFTETAEGEPVQGSEVSPIRMSFGAGFELRFTERLSFEPQGWLFRQEYVALDAYDKTVPTQIETGNQVGEIANTVGLALSVPLVYSLSPEWAPSWEFHGSVGLSLIYRIPVRRIDGSNAAPVGRYWIAGRFIYPDMGIAADYRFSDRIQVGAGITWYIPSYNAWGRTEDTPFLDETMLRYGLRVRWYTNTTES